MQGNSGKTDRKELTAIKDDMLQNVSGGGNLMFWGQDKDGVYQFIGSVPCEGSSKWKAFGPETVNKKTGEITRNLIKEGDGDFLSTLKQP